MFFVYNFFHVYSSDFFPSSSFHLITTYNPLIIYEIFLSAALYLAYVFFTPRIWRPSYLSVILSHLSRRFPLRQRNLNRNFKMSPWHFPHSSATIIWIEDHRLSITANRCFYFEIGYTEVIFTNLARSMSKFLRNQAYSSLTLTRWNFHYQSDTWVRLYMYVKNTLLYNFSF